MVSNVAFQHSIVTAVISCPLSLFLAAAEGWTSQPQPAALAPQSSGATPARKAQTKPTRADRYGDPLPPGAIARLGTMRFRHNDGVGVVAYSPNGKELITGCVDGTFHIWNTKGRKLRSISQPQALLAGPAFAISPDGKTGICAEFIRIRVWDLVTGKHHNLPGGEVYAWSVAFSTDGKLLAAAQYDAVTLWDMTTETELHRIERKDMNGTFVVISPDNRYLAWVATAPNAPRSPVLIRTIFLYDVKKRKEVHRLHGHDKRVSALAFSADGKTLFSASVDDTVRAWDVGNGKESWQLKSNGGKSKDDLFRKSGIDQLDGGVLALAVSGDGKRLAGGNFNGSIQGWDIATRKPLFRLPGHRAPITSLSFSPNDRSLASAGSDQRVRVWDLSKGKERFPTTEHAGYVRAVTVSPDGKHIASTGFGDWATCLWETKTFTQTADLQLHNAGFFRADFSRDGRLPATASWDNTVRVWNVATGKEIHQIRAKIGRMGSSVAFSPDGTMLATWTRGGRGTAKQEGYAIQLWDAATAKPLRTLKEDQRTRAYLGTLRFSPDGKMLAAHVDDNTVALFDTTTGKVKRRFPGGIRYEFAGDGKTLLIGSTPDGQWDPIRETVSVWDVAGGTKHYSFSLPKVKNSLDIRWRLPLSPDGRTLAVAGKEHAIALIEVATGQVRRRLAGHQGKITSLAFFPDGKRLVSSSYDTTCLVWDVARLRSAKAQADVSTLWQQLASSDAAKAYDAMLALIARRSETVAFLRKKLHPIAPLRETEIKKLIASLDSADFRKRMKAVRKIAEMDLLAEPHLTKARSEKSYPLEVHLRVEKLLEELHKPVTAPVQLLHVRSMEVLEHIGTPEARKLLIRLADGAPAARLTQEARAVLDRLGKASGDRGKQSEIGSEQRQDSTQLPSIFAACHALRSH